MDRQVITVDIAPGSNAQQRLLVAQGDIGRPLGVRIIQNGLSLNCTGYTAHLYVLKPDHNYYECTCTISNNNLISWDTAEQETPVSGECLAEIRITSGTNDIGTACFVEYVEASPADLGYASESLVSSMTEFVDAAQRAAEDATQAVVDVDNVNDVAVDASGHIVLSKVLGSTVTSDETVLQPTDIENDLLATTAGKVLDARQGKVLKDLIDAASTVTALTMTRTENAYVDATAFNRMKAYKKGNVLYINGNLSISTEIQSMSDFLKIGSIAGWNAVDTVFVTVVQQSNAAKVLILYILQNGEIYIYSATGATVGFYRFSACVPCA